MAGLTWLNVDELCAAVDLDESPAIVDLSAVTFFEPFAVVYLGMFLGWHNSKRKNFNLVLPRSSRAHRYLTTQNFWGRFNFNPAVVSEENLWRMTNTTSLNDVVDIEKRPGVAEEIGAAVLALLRRNRVGVRQDIVAELVAELADNFAQHSGRELAVFMIQRYPRIHRVDLAFGDCGVGIRASLAGTERFGYLSDQPHWEAALQAFEPGVTSKREGGFGLTDVRETINVLNGHLALATGDGWVQVSGGETRHGQMAYDLPGVQIELSFPEQA